MLTSSSEFEKDRAIRRIQALPSDSAADFTAQVTVDGIFPGFGRGDERLPRRGFLGACHLRSH